jgi:uncharacterized membrane protein
MTSSNEVLETQNRFKLIGWILFMSVLLNLFLVGVVMGIVPHGKHGPFGPMALAAPHGDYMVEWMTHRLDPADADAFREAFRAQADALKQDHEHVRRASDALAAIFQKPQPDPAALQTAMQQLIQAKNRVYETVGKIVETAYAKLSPEGRRRLADLTQSPIAQ